MCEAMCHLVENPDSVFLRARPRLLPRKIVGSDRVRRFGVEVEVEVEVEPHLNELLGRHGKPRFIHPIFLARIISGLKLRQYTWLSPSRPFSSRPKFPAVTIIGGLPRLPSFSPGGRSIAPRYGPCISAEKFEDPCMRPKSSYALTIRLANSSILVLRPPQPYWPTGWLINA